MLFIDNKDSVFFYSADINSASVFQHSDPGTGEAQRLHQEQAQHHVFFHSLFLHSLWMEPPPHSYLFSPFTPVLPQSARPQSSEPSSSPYLSMNIKSSCRLAVLFLVYYCFNNTQDTDGDHLLNTHHCRTCNTLTQPMSLTGGRRRSTQKGWEISELNTLKADKSPTEDKSKPN